jgi:virginiamycin B lyase
VPTVKRICEFVSLGLVLISLNALTAAAALAAESPCVVEVEIPDSPPVGITIRRDLAIDADGIVWFTQLELNQIGRFDPATSEFALFDIPTPDSGPHSIAVDSQGIVWFTETEGHQIGQFDPVSQTFIEEPTPTPGSKPYGITVDTRDNVWFTEMNAVAIGLRLARLGRMIEYRLNPLTDSVENLTVDPATGDVWVSELARGKLARLNPITGVISRFTIPYLFSAPHSVAVDAAGRVWFSDVVRNQIGRLEPATGTFRRFLIPTRPAVSHGIIVDSRGLVWFTELDGNKVAVLIPQLFNLILEFAVPTPGGGPYFVAEAPDGEIWFTEAHAPFIGRLPCTAR